MKKFQLIYSFILLISFCILSSCQMNHQSIATSTNTSLAKVNLPTSAYVLSKTSASTSSPTIEATPSVTPVIQKVQVISSTLQTNLPSDFVLDGVMVMSPKIDSENSTTLYMIDPNTRERITDLPSYPEQNCQMWGIDTSPNRQLFAYELGVEWSEYLYVIDASGKVLTKKLIVDMDGNYLLNHSASRSGDLAVSLYWLDNERLLTDMTDRDQTYLSYMAESAILFEPFTGNSYEYPPDYPGIIWWVVYGGWNSGGSTGMQIDPTLTRLLYVREDYRVILWDLENDEGILALPEGSMDSFGPMWKIDGSVFAIDLPVIEKGGDYFSRFDVRDLFIYTRDGQATRLTWFGETIPDANAFSPYWSPDGSKIAFMFSATEQNYCQEEGLITNIFPAVINVEQPDEVQLYCTNIEPYDGLIWSPDGKQILVKMTTTYPDFTVVTKLIDLQSGTISIFSEGDEPVGWLADE